MERSIFTPETRRRLKFSAVAAGALTLAACGGNFPGSQTLRQEADHGMAENGREFSKIQIQGKTSANSQELDTNGGANIRVGYIGDGLTNTVVAGVAPEGMRIPDAVIFDTQHGQAASFSCESVRDTLFYNWKSMSVADLKDSTCYILDFERFGKKVPSKK